MNECAISFNVLVVGMLIVLILGSCQQKLKTLYPFKIVRHTRKPSAGVHGGNEAIPPVYLIHTAGKRRSTRQCVRNVQKAVAQSEQDHARQLQAMGSESKEPPKDSVPVDVTRQALKLAFSAEQIECESLYPIMAQAAQAEKLDDIGKQFVQTMDAGACHWELFKDAIKYSGNIPQVKYAVCPTYGYVVTSVTTEHCPICSTTKETFVQI